MQNGMGFGVGQGQLIADSCKNVINRFNKCKVFLLGFHHFDFTKGIRQPAFTYLLNTIQRQDETADCHDLLPVQRLPSFEVDWQKVSQ